eukprot:TRINITY_DN463_c0_g1_i2.p1 TRINITY_DN463_c0_g1~~TRINITY_DN463_c0_g1_i2.p1  ORF type:complete len:349 (+),score=97.41 TRINITY_DN463_c0_g1_i2:2141-3187(+)
MCKLHHQPSFAHQQPHGYFSKTFQTSTRNAARRERKLQALQCIHRVYTELVSGIVAFVPMTSTAAAVASPPPPPAAPMDMDPFEALAVAKQHPSEEVVQMVAIKAVVAHADMGSGKRKRLDNAGACVVVLAAMKLHLHNPNMQTQACTALAKLAKTSSIQGKLKVVGFARVMVAVKTHATNAEVLTAGLAALPVLDPDRNADFKQVCACLIATLARGSDDNKATLMRQNAAGAIVQSMITYTGNAPLQRDSLRALAELCEGHPENATRLGRDGTCAVVTAVMNPNIADIGVQRNGLRAMCNLMAGEGNAARFRAANARAAVLAATLRHGEALPQDTVSGLLAQLSSPN